MTAADYSRVPVREYADARLQQLHDAMRLADGCWRAAHLHDADHDLVRALCADFVDAHHAFQRARFKRVRVRLTVIGLLREVQMHRAGR